MTLTLSGLTTGYGQTCVLTDVHFEVRAGDWLALLGRNGAGKTTLLHALLGRRPIKPGMVRIDGIDASQQPELIRARIGYAVPADDLPSGLTVEQFLILHARLKRHSISDAAWTGAVDVLQLGAELRKPLSHCSWGTRQKVGVAAVLLEAPSWMVFDESLNGLDPVVQLNLRSLLHARIAAKESAIIWATHSIDSVRTSCNRLVVLSNGHVIADPGQAEYEALRHNRERFEAFCRSKMGVKET